jgi:hypothetical protein
MFVKRASELGARGAALALAVSLDLRMSGRLHRLSAHQPLQSVTEVTLSDVELPCTLSRLWSVGYAEPRLSV